MEISMRARQAYWICSVLRRIEVVITLISAVLHHAAPGRPQHIWLKIIQMNVLETHSTQGLHGVAAAEIGILLVDGFLLLILVQFQRLVRFVELGIAGFSWQLRGREGVRGEGVAGAGVGAQVLQLLAKPIHRFGIPGHPLLLPAYLRHLLRLERGRRIQQVDHGGRRRGELVAGDEGSRARQVRYHGLLLVRVVQDGGEEGLGEEGGVEEGGRLSDFGGLEGRVSGWVGRW